MFREHITDEKIIARQKMLLKAAACGHELDISSRNYSSVTHLGHRLPPSTGPDKIRAGRIKEGHGRIPMSKKDDLKGGKKGAGERK